MRTLSLLVVGVAFVAACSGKVTVDRATGGSGGTSPPMGGAGGYLGSSSSPRSIPLDAGPIVITSSGSTNEAGFMLTITPDGHVAYECQPLTHIGKPPSIPNLLDCEAADAGYYYIVAVDAGVTTLSASLTQQIFEDVESALPFASRVFDNCPKSVSFGTRTSLAFAGQTIADVECGSATDPKAQALTTDTKDVEAAVASAIVCPP